MKNPVLYTLRRLAFVPLGVFLVASLTFWVINLIPSDPARQKLGEFATAEDIQRTREAMGLTVPVTTRYWHYLSRLFGHFDFGTSYYTDRKVWDDLVLYAPNSIELSVMAIAVAVGIGLSVGLVAASFRSRPPDHAARGFIVLHQSLPDFLLGLILIFFVFYKLKWVPAPSGRLGVLDFPPPARTHALLLDCILAGDWDEFGTALAHSILPVLTLGLTIAAVLAKATRSSVGNALTSLQVEFARACGLPERQVFLYAFRAARTPIITFGILLFTAIMGGAAVVETVFDWNGLGQFSVGRMSELDLPEMQGIIVVLGVQTLLMLVVLDIVIAFLDPRVSYGES